MLLYLKIFFASLLVLPAFNHAKQCSVPGQCTDSTILKAFKIETKELCLEEAKQTPNCTWYTFHPKYELCELFSECNSLTEDNCDECTSGESTCVPYKCEIQGFCQVILHIVYVANALIASNVLVREKWIILKKRRQRVSV